MSYRSCFLGIIVLATFSFLGENVAPAQGTTDFASWKEARNADAVPNLVRRMLVRDFRDLTGDAREELLAQTLLALKDIVSDDNVVHSTRFNAILAAGQLVATEATPGNMPTAYHNALAYLVDVYRDGATPHYVKYGALLGIVRHATLGVEPTQQDNVIDLFLETITTEFVQGELTLDTVPLEPAVWEWFRLAALDGLSALKTVGTNEKVVTELLSVINRKSQELEYLCRSQNIFAQEEWTSTWLALELASKAAKTLGDLDYKSATDIDAKKITDAFVRLTRAVCDVGHKMITDSTLQRGVATNPTALLEQIIIAVKMCTHSVVWGIRCGFLTGRQGENSLYVSLVVAGDDVAVERLNRLQQKIVVLSAFLDEGDRTRRPAAIVGAAREFKFDLSELGDVLKKTSDALAKIQQENSVPFESQ